MWIQTYTGKKFYFSDPRVDQINLVDIAHGLSLQCRFAGQCDVFYSVAEHCVRMVNWRLPGDAKIQLLHDAAEAYLSDIPTPIKRILPEFQALEDSILKAIFYKYGLNILDLETIKEADKIMCATEQRDIMKPPLDKWEGDYPEPYPVKIIPWTSQKAEHQFLVAAIDLGFDYL